ncbi:MAG: PfkB family carbohydrate kinase, partial [Burkholderiaceae bacterium]|nr:PfkB family carbohydrate kinase [Burkholderiaceae bacterium]
GPTLTPQNMAQCLDAMRSLDTAAAWWVASGSLPLGVPHDFYAGLAREARARGRKLIVDTSGSALGAALNEGVHMIKPSLRELRELTGLPLMTEAQQLQSARQLLASGKTRIVALSLGEGGAMLITDTHAWRARALQVQVRSTIGAGDSFVGGMVWALSRSDDDAGPAALASPAVLEQALRYGMAASAAALLSPGTALCQAADVHRLAAEVEIEKIILEKSS